MGKKSVQNACQMGFSTSLFKFTFLYEVQKVKIEFQTCKEANSIRKKKLETMTKSLNIFLVDECSLSDRCCFFFNNV